MPGLTVVRPLYERTFNKHISVLLIFEAGKYNYGTTQSGQGDQRIVMLTKGWGLMPEARYYPFTKHKPAPDGFFTAVYFRYRSLTETYNGANYLNRKDTISVITKGNAYHYGIDVGYKLTAGNVLLEILYGLGIANGTWQTPNERDKMDPTFKTDLSDMINSMRVEIALGFVFPKIKKNQPVVEKKPTAG